jgi:hypothetical protein
MQQLWSIPPSCKNGSHPWSARKYSSKTATCWLNSSFPSIEVYQQGILPNFPNDNAIHIYRYASNYRLAWVAKSCEFMPPNGCMYHETTITVGDLDGPVLIKLAPLFTGRSNYTTEEIQGKRAAYETAKNAADKAKSDLHPFGEYDY